MQITMLGLFKKFFGFFSGYTGLAYFNSNKSVSSGGSTLTDTSFNWLTNSLAGSYINIYNSSGALQFTRVIASNTGTVITITGTWPSSVSSCSYLVFTPLYLGEAALPFRRIYTGEGTSEGIRFGYGPTNGGQNGLLYSDAAGNLYYRDYAGNSIQLNVVPGP